MNNYTHLLLTLTLPIVIICGCGFLLQVFRKQVDSKLLADIALYLLAPALLFSTLSKAHISGTNVLHILLFTLIMTAALWVTSLLIARWTHLPEKTKSVLTLTTLFSNANNYGLPVLLLAYGSPGFALGAVYVIGQIILVNLLGLYIAARAKLSGRAAARRMLKTPLIYACIAGTACNVLHVSVPAGAGAALTMLGGAYPVIVLVILGSRLARTPIRGVMRRDVWSGVFMRLMVAPMIAKAALMLLGIHGMLASVLFVEASMPAAVNVVMLTEKFDGDSKLASLIVTVTTLLSFAYLPAVIAMG
ncbi:MAG: AEC family transporter [Sporolactobacillus sp.]